MMENGDIGFFVNAPNDFDLRITGHDLATDDGLRTSVLLSLFTDCRVNEEEVPVGELSQRGWWGDLFSDVDGDQLGSRLWLLNREKRTIETLNRAEDYARESLAWLVEDGVAETLDTQASYDENGNMILGITLTKPNNKGVFRFETKWQFEADQET
jgi:phage gp46-like protein